MYCLPYKSIDGYVHRKHQVLPVHWQNHIIVLCYYLELNYCNDPKFSDR